ncbi:PhoH family protein [Arthrobacter cryoconiti]
MADFMTEQSSSHQGPIVEPSQGLGFPHSVDGTRTEIVQFASTEQMVATLGAEDDGLRIVENNYPGISFLARGNVLSITGPRAVVPRIMHLMEEARGMVSRHSTMSAAVWEQLVTLLKDRPDGSLVDVLTYDILSSRGRKIRPKTLNQKKYVEAIDRNTVVFGIGPAGTGKTYLAMAKAVAALERKEVSRIILTRPAVEAGERLGFLPGTLNDKIDPYLRPLYDALHEMMDPETIPRLMAAGTIEVAPLAYMRGRTLNDAFIILDEAQNTTAEQMKMFLTRLGFGSKIVVTGDITQIDLPSGTASGLRVVRDILLDVDDISFSLLDATDVVRHQLVGAIVSAYNHWDESNASRSDTPLQRRKDIHQP